MNEIVNIEKDKIIKDNRLIEAGINNLNLNSFKLLLYMTTELIMENLEEQADGYKLTFRHGNFMDSIGYESERKYNELRKYLKELRNTTIEMPIIENGEEVGWFGTGFIDKYWVYKKGFSTVKFDKDLLPYLYKLKVEKETTILRYNLMKQFNSFYSMRVYEILVRWRNTEHKKVTVELEELKKKLGAKGKYKEIKDFENYVLKPAKKEINELSDIQMNYEKLALGERKGKGKPPITHIEFSFKLKREQQEEELLTEKQIIELMEIAEEKTKGTERTAKEYYDYCFSLTQEKCHNNKGFHKYIKNTIKGDNKAFLGQITMFTNPDVREKARQQSDKVQAEITRAKKEKIEQGQAEYERIVEEYENSDREERLKTDDMSVDELRKNIKEKLKGKR